MAKFKKIRKEYKKRTRRYEKDIFRDYIKILHQYYNTSTPKAINQKKQVEKESKNKSKCQQPSTASEES